ncbi:UNVERIFIED_CONTAM: hypothetical protein K2H54_036139 [Gekko kuhli]
MQPMNAQMQLADKWLVDKRISDDHQVCWEEADDTEETVEEKSVCESKYRLDFILQVKFYCEEPGPSPEERHAIVQNPGLLTRAMCKQVYGLYGVVEKMMA